MFELISLTAAFIGSVIGGVHDLKTSDMPDIVPYTMILIALLIHGYESYLAWSYWPLLNSAIVGLGLLAFGYLMYFTGQWGGGDGWMLAAIGFLLPTFNRAMVLPFPVTYMFNVFLIGTVYMLAYALVFALMNRNIIVHFNKSMKAVGKSLAGWSVVLFALLFAANIFLLNKFNLGFDLLFSLQNTALILLATIGIFSIYKFAKSVEELGFKKRIPVSKLKVGDVLLENKYFEGITEKQLKQIRHSKRFVWVKEGVRFAPTFPLALLFTLIYGDSLLLFIRFFV